MFIHFKIQSTHNCCLQSSKQNSTGTRTSSTSQEWHPSLKLLESSTQSEEECPQQQVLAKHFPNSWQEDLRSVTVLHVGYEGELWALMIDGEVTDDGSLKGC